MRGSSTSGQERSRALLRPARCPGEPTPRRRIRDQRLEPLRPRLLALSIHDPPERNALMPGRLRREERPSLGVRLEHRLQRRIERPPRFIRIVEPRRRHPLRADQTFHVSDVDCAPFALRLARREADGVKILTALTHAVDPPTHSASSSAWW